MLMSARDQMKGSDAKRLALRKAVLSLGQNNLKLRGTKMPKTDAEYFIQAYRTCQETFLAAPLVLISAPGDN